MAAPSESILRSNVLVRLKNNEFRCSVCTNDAVFSAWQQHVADAEHVATLKQFDSTFERRGNWVRCRLCHEFVSNDAARIHGKSHSVVPWHRPSDQYQQFFENRIVEWKKRFHCFLCDASFDHWFVALLHVKEKTHQTRSKDAAVPIGFSSLIPAGETYESLVLEGLVPHTFSRLECKFCRDVGIGLTKVAEHIRDFSHRCEKLISSPMAGEKNGDAESGAKEIRYFEKFTENFFICIVCDSFFGASEEKKKLHLAEETHSVALKKYGCDSISSRPGDIYHCDCCDVSIPDLKCLRVHIKQESHVASVLQSRKPKTETASELVFQNTLIWIGKRDTTNSYCRLCETELPDVAAIKNHVAESGHAATLTKFGCENLSPVEGNVFSCRCCNCRISGHHNVYLHTRGRPHSFALVDFRRRQRDEAKSERPEWSKVVSSMVDQLSKLSEQIKAKPSAENFRSLANQPVNLVVEEITCNFCSVVVPSCVELHSHMAGHFSADFVISRVDKNANNQRNPYAGKTRVEQKKIAESLKTFAGKFGAIEDAKSGNETRANLLPPDAKIEDGKSDLSSTKRALSKPFTVASSNGSSSDDEDSSDEAPRKTTIQRIARMLDFDEDYIYDMSERLREIELGMKWCMVVDVGRIYCLICRKVVVNTLQDYFEHLRGLDHVEYLDGMEKDHRLFELATGQFSELDLADQYMEETSDDLLRCLVCDEEVANDDYAVQDHIEETNHQIIRDEMHAAAQRNYEDIKSRMHCDWYNVHKYWCVLCSADFESEVHFVKHLGSRKHAIVENQRENIGKTMVYDFCAPCALLWYGYRCAYAYHCTVMSHKWLVRDGHYVLPDLPEAAKKLLAAPERHVDETIDRLESVRAEERENEEALKRDLESAVGSKFRKAEAHVFGSRASGLGSPNSDIDVFLDCGNRYDGNGKSEQDLKDLMIEVEKCLHEDSQAWDVNELLTNSRSPIIRANHRATGLAVDITVENGLSVENTKLVKSFNDVFPPCRKLTLFLKQWLTSCNLSGSDRISSYALCWFVIFYLQKESILPSVATLIAMNKKSQTIAGWEVGVSHEFSYNEAASHYSLKEFLVRFFTFYANFDFRYDAACPLLGEVIEKRAFADHRRLPKEMAPYVAYMEKNEDPEPLRIDSAMCIQDPFDLQHNITKAVSKVFLCRFRTCCSKSLDLLCS